MSYLSLETISLRRIRKDETKSLMEKDEMRTRERELACTVKKERDKVDFIVV